MNRTRARQLILHLLSQGVQEFYVCAGARNVPFLEALSHWITSQPRVFTHFEERCAAFYALGRIKQIGAPVAVIVTSGSAVAELLPAAMEAYYAELPLVLISGDRPSYYHGSGAPQAAELGGIFGCYARVSYDENDNWEQKPIASHGPTHFNVRFDVPLLSGDLESICAQPKRWVQVPSLYESVVGAQDSYQKFLRQYQEILVIVGGLFPWERPFVKKALLNLAQPVYVEALSGLREDPDLAHLRVHFDHHLWQDARDAQWSISGVLKLGRTPVSRLWRDLDEKIVDLPFLSITTSAFSGSPMAEFIQIPSYELFSQWTDPRQISDAAKVFLADNLTSYKKSLQNQLAQDQEGAYVHGLSQCMPPHSTVFVGSSLPIRHWDNWAAFEEKYVLVEGSRGVNGIDGQISTALGWAHPTKPNFCILGDLTTLYDMAGPWVLSYPHAPQNWCFVILNNSGGGIFSRIFEKKIAQLMMNSHSQTFEHWAAFWKLSYTAIHSQDEFLTHCRDFSMGRRVVEIFC